MWPRWFRCFCARGRLWWQDDQKLYMCNAGCGTSLIPDVSQKTIGNDLHRLNRDQAWERSPLDRMVKSNNVDMA
jgi:hypothetical protein